MGLLHRLGLARQVPLWLLTLDICSFITALASGALLGEAGGHIFGAPAGLLYVLLGLSAVLLAGIGAVVVGVALLRPDRGTAGHESQQAPLDLGSPLLFASEHTQRVASAESSASADTQPGGLGLQPTAPSEGSAAANVQEGDSSLTRHVAVTDMAKAKRLAQMDHAVTVRRRAIFVAAYLAILVLSFGLGIEAVDLRSGGSAPVGIEITYVAAAIASLQASFFFTKRIVSLALASPEIKLELRAVHVHSLHFAVDAFDHSCDICGDEIEGGECFRCRLCDFDYCLECFKKGQKLQDWGLLRGDKGVKVPQRVRQANMVTFFCRALALLASYRLHVFGTATCLLFNVICRLLVPNLEGGLFDDLIAKQADRFLNRIKLLVLYWVGQTVFQSSQRYISRLMSRKLRLDLRMRLFERLLAQDIAFFDATRSGAMAQRVEGDVEDMSRPVPILINTVLKSVLLIVGALICCLISSARLTVLSAACLFPMAYLTRMSAEWGSGLSNQMEACQEEGNSIVTEAMTNIRHVRAFSAENYEAARYRRVLSRLFRKMHKEALGDMIIENMYGSLEFLVEMLVLFFGGMAIVQGHDEALTVGSLIAFTMYWDILREGVDSIQDMFSELAQAAGAAQRVFDLMDISPDIPLNEGVEVGRETFLGKITFGDVHFAYQARPDKLVCQGLCLAIPARGTCALVGRSGAGKSTLMHLLLRFYDVQQGEIRIDGIPLTQLNLKTLHDLTGFVSQDTKLHFGSIRDNLTYGLPWPAPEDGELEAVARATNCAEFIDEMEDGFDSKVGEGGVRLSGGQRQRLAIARAFLRRPKLLILDEATSHLDAENEQLVQTALDSLIQDTKADTVTTPGQARTGGCTVILIAHRLSTVKNADVIAVMSEGVVVEQGSHEQLLEDSTGIYARLVAKQAERAANVLPEEGVPDRGKNVDKLFDGVLGRKNPSGSGSDSESGSGSDQGSEGSSSCSSSTSSVGPASQPQQAKSKAASCSPKQPLVPSRTEDQTRTESSSETYDGVDDETDLLGADNKRRRGTPKRKLAKLKSKARLRTSAKAKAVQQNCSVGFCGGT